VLNLLKQVDATYIPTLGTLGDLPIYANLFGKCMGPVKLATCITSKYPNGIPGLSGYSLLKGVLAEVQGQYDTLTEQFKAFQASSPSFSRSSMIEYLLYYFSVLQGLISSYVTRIGVCYAKVVVSLHDNNVPQGKRK